MDSQPPSAAEKRRARVRRVRRAGGWSFAIAAHAVVLVAMAAALPHAQTEFDPEPITVALVTLPPPPKPPPPPRETPTPAPQAKAAPPKAAPPKAPPKAAPAQAVARLTHNPTAPAVLPAAAVSAPTSGQGVSDSDLAGAQSAESGDGGGRPCNMARRVQDALRKDPLVQNAVAGLGARAVRVWDGDWVWLDGEDGRGLTAVRQAMMWEIAFAPPECRGQAVHGLVVLSPDRSGTRLVVGLGDWRWSDLLTPHPRSARD